MEKIQFMQATGYDINIKANNITFCYDDVGKGNIPVLFVHGFPFDKSMWKPQFDFLKSTHRVIAVDLRGFGKSTDNLEKASITLFADDLIKLMDGLDIKKAIVCGLSMGGYIVLNAVNRFPERFAGIILSDTQCNADTPEAREKRYKTIQQIEADGLIDFAESFVKNIFSKNSLEERKDQVEKIKKIILSTSPKTVAAALVALAERWESCSGLNSISVPALILCGKEDIITPPERAEFLHQNIKNSKIQIIDGAGHMSNIEQSNVFNKHIEDFLSAF